jgi:hypothetical protein
MKVHTFVSVHIRYISSKILSDWLSIVSNLLEECTNYSAVAQLLIQAETGMSIYMSLSALATHRPRLF